MKKFFILQIVVVSFLVLSCKNFLSENSLFASKMAEEVSYATATEIFVTVSEPTEGSTKYGNMIKGSRDVKVGFPFEIEYELAKEEGYFCYWEAFENYSANKTNTPITDTEIIEFEDIYKNPTKVTLKKEVQNIRIIPKINKTPMINIESPDYGTSSLTGLTKLLPGETIPVVISSFDQYGITNLKITSRDISKEIISSLDLRTIESFSESVLLKDSKDHILFTLTNLRVSSNLSTVSFILEAGSGLDAVYNLGADFAPRPQIDATSNVPSQSEGVMRTTPIKIKFTNEMDVSLITAENYKEFISISRVKENPETSEETIYDCFSDSEYNDKSYFSVPEFLSDKKTLLISPVNKLDKTEWLPSGSKLRVTISESLCDINSVPMLNKYSFAFTLGTEGDAEGPIITNEKTSLSIVSSKKEISQSEWGDFEPSKNADEDHTYADSIHVGPGESFKAVIQASDLSTGDTGIKEFVADIRLMYIYEGGRLPNSSEKALKNLILFDKDGNWLYESGFLKQDFYKEKSLSYSGTNKLAQTENDFIFDFEDFITDESSGSLSVDGIYRIALTAKDGLDNYSANPNVYYVVRDTTPPDAEKNANSIKISSSCISENRNYWGFSNRNIKISTISNIFDFGIIGQPFTGSKKDKLKWSFSLSESFGIPSNTWTEWEYISLGKEISIPDSYFNSSVNDKVLYLWVKLVDDLGNTSVPCCLKTYPIYIDIQKPSTPKIVTNSAELDLSAEKLFIPSESTEIEWTMTNLSQTGFPSDSYIVVVDSDGEHITENNSFIFENEKNYSVYSIDSLGNKSNELIFEAVFDNTSPILNFISLKSDYEKNISGYINDDGKYKFSSKAITIGSGSEFTYDISGYTAGGVKLDFSVTKGGKGLTENGISVSGMEITSYKIGNNAIISCSDNPITSLPIQTGTINNNTIYTVYGNLTCPLDGSNDGEKTVSVTVSDGVHENIIRSKSIILDSTPPSLEIDPIVKSRCGYVYKDDKYQLLFKDFPQYTRPEYILTPNNLGSDSDYVFDYSAYYKISDTGIGSKYLDSNYMDLTPKENLKTQKNYYYEYNNSSYFYQASSEKHNANQPLGLIFAKEGTNSIKLTELYNSKVGYSADFEISDILGNKKIINKYCGWDIEGPKFDIYGEKNSLNSWNLKSYSSELNAYIYQYYVGENEDINFKIYDNSSKIKYMNITADNETGNVFNKVFYEDGVISLNDINNGKGTLYKMEGSDIVGNISNFYISIVKDISSPQVTEFKAYGYGSKELTSEKYFNKDILVKVKVQDNSYLTNIKFISNHKLKKYSENQGGTWYDAPDNNDFFKINTVKNYEAWFVFTPEDPNDTANLILSFVDFFGNEKIQKTNLKIDKHSPRIDKIGTGQYNSSTSETGYKARYSDNKQLENATFNMINSSPYERIYVRNKEIYIDSYYKYISSTQKKFGNQYVEFRIEAYDEVNQEASWNAALGTKDSESPFHVVLSGNSDNEVIPIDNWYNFKFTYDSSKNYVLKLYDNLDNVIEFPVHINRQEYSTAIDFDNGYVPVDLKGDKWVLDSENYKYGSGSLKTDIKGQHNTSCQKEIKTLCKGISFNYKISTEKFYDFFEFYIDDECIITKGTQEEEQGNGTNKASGEIDWKHYYNRNLELKEHTFKWIYKKDPSQNSGNDCVWIDSIAFLCYDN